MAGPPPPPPTPRCPRHPQFKTYGRHKRCGACRAKKRREAIAREVFTGLASMPQQLIGGTKAEAEVAAEVAFEWADAFIARAARDE